MAPALLEGFTSTVGAVSVDLNFLLLDFNGHRYIEPQRLVRWMTTLSFS